MLVGSLGDNDKYSGDYGDDGGLYQHSDAYYLITNEREIVQSPHNVTKASTTAPDLAVEESTHTWSLEVCNTCTLTCETTTTRDSVLYVV
jgi:hypothetical protein